MVYVGYLGFGGTEIVNGGRVSSYTRLLLPNLDVQGCAECEDLHEALGHKPYTSPLVDQPDWFDADNPDTWDFYGLYPLSFEGFEDATTEATVTQFNQDGGAVSRPRRATRSLRVSGLLIGGSAAAVSAGMTWLRQALRPTRCRDGIDCTGDHLCYFVACPPLCLDTGEQLAVPTNHEPVRECESGVVIEPIGQCTFPFERHLYEATVVDGPRIIREFDPECGAMAQVEFTIVTGVPSPFGTAVHVATGPTGPLVTVPNITCQPDAGGIQVLRRNYALNPGPSATGGWVASNTPYTVTRDGPPRRAGVPSVRATRNATGGTATTLAGVSNVGAYGTGATQQPLLSTTPLLTYLASLYVTASIPARATLTVQPTTEAGANVGAAFTAVQNVGTGWSRLHLQFNAPATATRARISVFGSTLDGSAAAVGSFIAVADALLEADSGTPLMWFDGASVSPDADLDYVWSGTVGQSVSVLQQTVASTGPILDPDCPPVPPAPRPPVIDETCITDPASYVRYTAVVPSDAVPLWSDAVPIIRVYSGPDAVRQMRVRFYDNAFEVPTDQLDPCVFCGEFIVSYLPANSLLTIDGITQTATVTQPGQLAQTASHLLYGSGGGPMVWPHLTCGIRYDMTVDIVPDVTDLTIDLCVAGRE